MGNIKAILFDLEGTLVYYKKRHNPIEVCELIRQLGCEVYYQEWEAARRFVFFVDMPKGRINNWNGFIEKVFEGLEINVSKEVVEKVADYYKKNTIFKYFDDVSTIKELPVKKAIVTTVPRFYFPDLNLNAFDLVITGKESGVSKGNPKVLLKALNKLKVKPEEALMVGDNMDCDISPAKDIGMGVVLIDRNNLMENVNCKKIRALWELKSLI